MRRRRGERLGSEGVLRLRAGFSLVEMLAVLLILGLIATVVTVNWAAILPKSELHSAVREIASTIQSTRSEAIARNAVYRVEYDLDNRRWRVNTPFQVAGDGVGRLAYREEDRMSLGWNQLPDSIRFATVEVDGIAYSEGIVRVRFDPLGSSSAHVITLQQKPADNYYTIDVQGLTGLIDYHEGLWSRPPAREEDFD